MIHIPNTTGYAIPDMRALYAYPIPGVHRGGCAAEYAAARDIDTSGKSFRTLGNYAMRLWEWSLTEHNAGQTEVKHVRTLNTCMAATFT